MQISIISTVVETKPTQKGSYQQLEVVYKNLTFQGKVESKKIMSFGNGQTAFKILSNAQSGQVYDVEVVKNAQGYNDWTEVVLNTGAAYAGEATGAASTGMLPKATTTATKTTYETPEERAQRQILIVRQSSISSAVAVLTAGAKSPPKSSDVIALAKEFEAYVFGMEAVDTGPTGFDDLPDFNAEVS